MTWNLTKCPIWETPAEVKAYNGNDILTNSLRMDGLYRITDRVLAKLLAKQDDRLSAKLTTWVVEQHRLGVEVPFIDEVILEAVARRQPMPVARRAEMLLAYADLVSEHIGFQINFGDKRRLLAWTESSRIAEIEFLLKYTSHRGWVNVEYLASFNAELAFYLKISDNGYAKLDEIRSAHTISSQAFVAMWFDLSMKAAYDNGLKPGIEDAGYIAVRVDGVAHNNRIDDAIIAEIRRSRFLVADFTHGDGGPRGGVYYEAGFAHGLNIAVIFCCRQDMIGQVHFDTRQYNHITWTEPAELRKKLADRISATIGDGPNREELR
ncbi:MAG: hypothetical protein P4L82_07285 [Ancalomicrobiaceae bacterium]|nr:hypothetical protein [Ancalomicrobiaceae bacterium]